MKTFVIYSSLALLNFIFSFFIYNYSFNQQATPYLTEEQRVDSSILMLTTTIPAYIFTAAILSAVFYFVAKKYNKR